MIATSARWAAGALVFLNLVPFAAQAGSLLLRPAQVWSAAEPLRASWTSIRTSSCSRRPPHLVRSLARFLDEQFLSSNAAVLNVSPGGILAGLPAGQSFPSAGPSWEQILWDATNAVNLLNNGLVSARRPTWIMSPANRASVSFLPNALGLPARPAVRLDIGREASVEAADIPGTPPTRSSRVAGRPACSDGSSSDSARASRRT
jgi:hypothetical protein